MLGYLANKTLDALVIAVAAWPVCGYVGYLLGKRNSQRIRKTKAYKRLCSQLDNISQG